jgi:WD40 repeat protein
LRGWEWHYLRRLGRGKGQVPLRHAAAVLGAAICPDGKRIASADQSGFIKIWDIPSGQLLHSVHAYPGRQARSVAFSPDGQRLASACFDGTLTVWEAESGRPLHSWKAHPTAKRVTFGSDGRCLVSGGGDEHQNNGEVRIWDATTYDEILAIEGLNKRDVWGLALSPTANDWPFRAWAVAR